MDTQTLLKIFNCCILVGIAIPVLGLILGGISYIFDIDLDLDGDMDSPLPVTPVTFAFAAVVFGALGRLLLTRAGAVTALISGLIGGLAGGVLLARYVVRPLRRNRADAQRIDDLLGAQGRVQLEVRPDFKGTIAVHSSIGSLVTYDALPAEGVEILPIGAQVQVVFVDAQKRICIVRPLEENGAGDCH